MKTIIIDKKFISDFLYYKKDIAFQLVLLNYIINNKKEYTLYEGIYFKCYYLNINNQRLYLQNIW